MSDYQQNMKYIGVHLPTDNPHISCVPEQAAALGATAFAINTFETSNGWRTDVIPQDECRRFIDNCWQFGFSYNQILPHASFMINLCSPEPRKLAMSRRALIKEMESCRSLGLTMINFHPGATLGKMSEEDACSLVAESIDYVLERTEGVTAVIENTAGQGSNIGYKFGHIGSIVNQVSDKSRVGVCIDTCHAFAGGYDLTDDAEYERAREEFDREIGFQYLRGMHINDSLRGVNSRIDRHASIGLGAIGRDFFMRLMADKLTDNIPLILETPGELLWAEEIAVLQSAALS